MSPRFDLRHLGRDLTVEVREHDLVAGAQTITFDAIREVRVSRIGTLEVCVLRLVAGGEHTFATDEAARRPAFAGAVRALWAALAARQVPFVSGSWLIAGMIATITVVVGVLGALVFTGVIDAPAFARRGGMLALVCAVLGPVGAFTSRPRALTSAAALDAALPRG